MKAPFGWVIETISYADGRVGVVLDAKGEKAFVYDEPTAASGRSASTPTVNERS